MIDQDDNQKRRSLPGVAAIALVAGLGGLALSSCGADKPAETAASNTTTAAAPEKKVPDTVTMRSVPAEGGMTL